MDYVVVSDCIIVCLEYSLEPDCQQCRNVCKEEQNLNSDKVSDVSIRVYGSHITHNRSMGGVSDAGRPIDTRRERESEGIESPLESFGCQPTSQMNGFD
ncbi:hypothetical protein PFISCL1PPCAC_19388 [Pristionchus fissidentatus]|uniref:Uncharacterized protein n=1 Tax=Pristionchus fissidentatus TaxID=1538716 RepID=A0AAV5W8E3_9BILA|nr:hypothetical protein PFISCL1PPCAC_19388 [Pristionchus fissidentatus]